MNRSIGIVGTGSYLPGISVSNEQIAGRAGVTGEWIERKTGIKNRRQAAPHEATSDLAATAARRALAQAGGDAARNLSHIVVATSTPDHPQPATASIVQHLIHAYNAAAFDVNSVCSGFVYALTVAEGLLQTEPRNSYALVIGADIYSRILDYSDRATAVLFGDGAGAVVLGPVPPGRGTLASSLLTRGDQHDLIGVPAGGSRLPASEQTLAEGEHFFKMNGRGVRGFVEENLPAAIHGLLNKAGAERCEVRHFIPHQANGVMLGAVWPRLGLEEATCHVELRDYGNTGSASIPITLDSVHQRGLLADEDLVLLCGFGGGMSVGATLLRWAPTRCARRAVVQAREPVVAG